MRRQNSEGLPKGVAAVVIFVYVNLVHLLALLKKDNGIMDAAWGMGFILVALFTLRMADGLDARRLLLAALVLLWGARLSLHILIRNVGRAGEDFRYRNWRETWGRWFYVLMDDEVMLNRATMSKWGFRLGEVTLAFRKLRNEK